MSHDSNSHLAELLDRFYKIGRTKYNGMVYDNVLNIFDELDIEDQKALLRGALGVYATVTSVIIHEREIIDKGDANALLLYLNRVKGDSPQSNENPKPPASDGFDRLFIKLVAGLVFGWLFIASYNLVSLAASDDPAALANAKFYITIFEMFDPR